MKSKTFKWIILLYTIVIGLLVIAQLFWLNKIYNYEQKQFNTSVIKSIKSVYEDMELVNSSRIRLQILIEQPDFKTFIFKIDSIPPQDSLLYNIQNNFEDFGLFVDCKVAMYSESTRNYLFQEYLPSPATKHSIYDSRDIPIYKKKYDYVCLFFPYETNYILNEMTWWIISSLLLLILLIALGWSIFHLYKQRFLNEVQNDFIRNVTHEFQTPLTTLTLGLDIIAKPGITENPEKLIKYTKLMQGQTTYLRQHIENLMKVLKSEANGIPVNKEMVSPNELIKDAIKQLYASIEEKNAVIELRLEDSNGTILADSSSLYVAIINLISNAIKYAEKPIVIIETRQEKEKYIISVKDNGIGIAQEYQKKLFEKFYRVPVGDVHDVKGLGLGLYFVKKVVTEHHGSISLKSILGVGTEFTVTL